MTVAPRVASPSCTTRLRVARFVKEGRGYNSEIVVAKDGAQANARSSWKMMTRGDGLVIRAKDEEAPEAPVAVLSREEGL